MTDEIERGNGEIRWWLGGGWRMMWTAEPGRRPRACFLQHYRDGRWWSHPVPHWRQYHPAPRWPL